MPDQRPSEELLKHLENLPAAEPRSKLEPLRDYILRWRRQGRSYRRIQQILREHCQMDVAYETLRRFVQRRENPRTAGPAVETGPVREPAKRLFEYDPNKLLTIDRSNKG